MSCVRKGRWALTSHKWGRVAGRNVSCHVWERVSRAKHVMGKGPMTPKEGWWAITCHVWDSIFLIGSCKEVLVKMQFQLLPEWHSTIQTPFLRILCVSALTHQELMCSILQRQYLFNLMSYKQHKHFKINCD